MLHLIEAQNEALDTGPSLDTILEARGPGGTPFWGGKDQLIVFRNAIDTQPTVWVFETIYQDERGDDAFYYDIYDSKEAALWEYWFDELEMAYECENDDVTFNATEHLASVLTELQELRDEGIALDGEIIRRLTERKVN